MLTDRVKAAPNSWFFRWLNSQVFWRSKPSESSGRLSFQRGKTPLWYCYGLIAIAIGIFELCAAFFFWYVRLSDSQINFTSPDYVQIANSGFDISLLWVVSALMILLGTLMLGLNFNLIFDADQKLILKNCSLFKFSLWSKSWDIKDLRGFSICSYGKAFFSIRLYQLRLVRENQPAKAILTCDRTCLAPLQRLAEQSASFLNVPLSSN